MQNQSPGWPTAVNKQHAAADAVEADSVRHSMIQDMDRQTNQTTNLRVYSSLLEFFDVDCLLCDPVTVVLALPCTAVDVLQVTVVVAVERSAEPEAVVVVTVEVRFRVTAAVTVEEVASSVSVWSSAALSTARANDSIGSADLFAPTVNDGAAPS